MDRKPVSIQSFQVAAPLTLSRLYFLNNLMKSDEMYSFAFEITVKKITSKYFLMNYHHGDGRISVACGAGLAIGVDVGIGVLVGVGNRTPSGVNTRYTTSP